MKKKLMKTLSFLLVFAMVFSLSIPTYASEPQANDTQQSEETPGVGGDQTELNEKDSTVQNNDTSSKGSDEVPIKSNDLSETKDPEEMDNSNAGIMLTNAGDANTDIKVVNNETDLNSALTSGGEVQLSTDITLTNVLEISSGITVTLDLAGHTLTQNKTYTDENDGKKYLCDAIDNNGSLTIKDTGSNGKIVGRIWNSENSTVVIEKAIVQANVDYVIFNNGEMKIEDGTYLSEDTTVYNGGTLTINGGTFSGPNIAIDNEANLTISGGTFSGSNCCIYSAYDTSSLTVNNGTLNEKIRLGGTVNFTKPYTFESGEINGDINMNNITVNALTLSGTISSGEYDNVVSCSATFPKGSEATVHLKDAALGSKSTKASTIGGGYFDGTVSSVNKLSLSGGTFSQTVYDELVNNQAACASGYNWEDNTNGTYSVKQVGIVDVSIQPNDVSYGSLTDISYKIGSSSVSAQNGKIETPITKGGTITFSATATPNANYTFAGWYTNQDGTGSPVSTEAALTDFSYTVNEATTIYAVFKVSAEYQKLAEAASTWLAQEQTDGTYKINTLEDMYSFAYAVNHLGKTFKDETVTLTADLNYSEESPFMPVGGQVKFAGTFDGGNHTISGITYEDTIYAGIFGYNTGTIKNLKVQDCIFTGGDVGGIAAWSEGSIENCSVTNCTLAGGDRYTGGMVGHSFGIQIKNVIATDNTLSGWKTGGLVGYADQLNVEKAEVKNNTCTNDSNYGIYGVLCGHLNAGASTLTGADISDSQNGSNALIGTNYSGSNGTLTISETEQDKTNIQVSALSGDMTSNKQYTLEGGSYQMDKVISAETTSEDAGLTITGGTYKTSSAQPLTDANQYVPEGKALDSTGKVVTVAAKIGDVSYETLEAAVASVNNNEETTITLLADVTESITIPADKNITLDLNGKTLTNTEGKDTITVDLNGVLTVIDGSAAAESEGTGKVINTSNGCAAIYNNGTATLKGGTYTRTAGKWYTICNHGTMMINNGVNVTVDASVDKNSSMIENGYYSYSGNDPRSNYVADTNQPKPSLTISGGTFSGGFNTIKNDDGADLKIAGGNFTCSTATQAVIFNASTAEITNGTFTSKTNSGYAIYNLKNNVSISDQTIKTYTTVSGGNFSGKINVDSGTTLAISDGTFNIPLKESWCDTAYVPTSNTSGGSTTYTVKEGTDIVSVMDSNGQIKTYNSLARAVSAASEGDTITLLDNIELSEYVTVSKTLTLNLDGHNIDRMPEVTGAYLLHITTTSGNKGDLTVIDSSQNHSGVINGDVNQAAEAISITNGKVTIKNGTVKGKTYGIYVYTNGTLNVEGGIIEGSTSGIYSLSKNANTTISDGAISGDSYGIYDLYGTVTIKNKAHISGGIYGILTGYPPTGSSAPNLSTVNVDGGAITGVTGGICVGNGPTTLNVRGGTITGTGKDLSYGIYIVSPKTVTVGITGGEIAGTSYGIYENSGSAATLSISEDSTTTPIIKATDSNGTALYSKNCTGFVSGGIFSSDVTQYCVDSKKAVANTTETTYTIENANQRNVVTYSSMVDGSITSVANTSGGGIYYEGRSVTLTASDMNGLAFKGWYKISKINKSENGMITGINYFDQLSSDAAYTFIVPDGAEDINIVAVYESTGEKVRLRIGGADFSVNGKAQTSGYDTKFAVGTQITVNYTGSNTFYHWKNDSDKLVSKETEYTFTIVTDTDLTPVFANEDTLTNSAFVEFVSAYDQVLQADIWNSDDMEAAHSLPAGPSKIGGTFKFWSLNADDKEPAQATVKDILEAVKAENNKHITVKPVYEDSTATYTITIQYPGNVIDSTTYADRTYGTAIYVTAKDIEGQKFSHWSSDADGTNILSYSQRYGVQVSQDMTLYPIYVADSETVQAKPTINITNKFSSVVDGNNKVSFETTRSIPDGYELIEHGVLRTTDELAATVDAMQTNNTNTAITTHKSTDFSKQGIYTLNINVGAKTDVTIYARGYAIVRNTATNETETVYTAIESGSFNGLNNGN